MYCSACCYCRCCLSLLLLLLLLYLLLVVVIVVVPLTSPCDAGGACWRVQSRELGRRHVRRVHAVPERVPVGPAGAHARGRSRHPLPGTALAGGGAAAEALRSQSLLRVPVHLCGCARSTCLAASASVVVSVSRVSVGGRRLSQLTSGGCWPVLLCMSCLPFADVAARRERGRLHELPRQLCVQVLRGTVIVNLTLPR